MTIRRLCIGAVVLSLWGSGNLHAADTLHQSPANESKKAADSLQRSPERKKKEKQSTDSLQRSQEKKKQEADSLKLAKKKKKQEDDSLKLARKKEKQHADSLKLVAKEKKKQEADSLKLAQEKEKQLADSLKLARKKEKQETDSLNCIAREKKKQLADSLKLSRGLKDKPSADSLQRSPEHGSSLRKTDTLPSHPQVFLGYTIPAATGGALKYSLAGSLYYGNDASMVRGIGGGSSIVNLNDARSRNRGAAKMVTGDLGLEVGVHRMVDLSVALPLYIDFTGWGITKRTIGDLSFSGTFVPVPYSRSFHLGARLSVIAPTGNQEEGLFPRHVYYIQTNPATAFDRGVTFAHNKFYLHPSMIASFDLQKIISRLPLEMHLNVGGVFSEAKERFTVDGALALALRPVRPLTVSLEFASETRPFVKGRSIINGFLADPLRCVPAMAVDLPAGITLRLSGDIGLSSGKDTLRSNWHRGGYAYATKALPFYGIAFSIVYRGRLPRLGILPEGTASGGFSGEIAASGDHDRDGIPDSLDNCPGTPEDRDGFSDTDGCPDYDNDNDGIADEVDGCPVTPEDVDRFEDGDGCPDIDNDKDGIIDSTDACPDEKGPEHNRGCPETGDLAFERTVLAAVAFEPGTSRIVSGTEMLDRIFTAMQKAPTSTIEFQVHTDNLGSADSCRVLSQNRADVLKLYLVAKGIRPDRIKAVGLGSEFPVADNSTESGRAKNRRVEVRRIE